MKTTSGVFIFDKIGLVLIGHPTGFAFGEECWSIPKGEPDEGEELMNTAIREVWEESSIRIDSDQLKYIGSNVYKSGKKTIHAYAIKLAVYGKDLNPACTSSFINKIGEETFEIDQFRWVKPEDAKKLVHEAQKDLLEEAIKQIGNGGME